MSDPTYRTTNRVGLKLMLLTTAASTGIISCCRFANRRKVRILAYHGVDWLHEPVINWDGLQVRPRVFRAHLEELRRSYNVVSLNRVIDALVNGEDLPPNAVAITFDDGYRNNLTLAAPLLQEFGFPATFFVSTGFVDGITSPWWYRLREAVARTNREYIDLPGGETTKLDSTEKRVKAAAELEVHMQVKPSVERERCLRGVLDYCGVNGDKETYPLMDRNDTRKLAEMGFDIGPHTVTHISMSDENESLIEQEIDTSLSAIRDITGSPAICYSYPHGALPKEYHGVMSIMKCRGIRAAVTTVDGMISPGDDIFRLKRLNVSGHRRAAFLALLSGFTGLVHRT